MLKVLTVLQQALCMVKGFPDKADMARALETFRLAWNVQGASKHYAK